MLYNNTLAYHKQDTEVDIKIIRIDKTLFL